jgi:hypothetical protein
MTRIRLRRPVLLLAACVVLLGADRAPDRTIRPETGDATAEQPFQPPAVSRPVVEPESVAAPEYAPPGGFQYLKVIGTAFRPRVSTTTYTYTTDGCVYQTGGTDVRFQAPVNLPEGSILKFVRIYYMDTVAQNLTVWLTRYDPGQANQDIASVSSTGTGGFGTTLSPEISPFGSPLQVVDQFNYAYVLNWGPGVNSAGNQLCGVRIAYYKGADGHFNNLSPCRVIDTRFVAAQTNGNPLPNPGPHNFRIQGNCGVPNGATAVVLNATVVSPSRAGDLRLFPAGGAQPDVSVVNYPAGVTIANGAVVPLTTIPAIPPDGDPDPNAKDIAVVIGMTGPGTIHLLLDVTGYYY